MKKTVVNVEDMGIGKMFLTEHPHDSDYYDERHKKEKAVNCPVCGYEYVHQGQTANGFDPNTKIHSEFWGKNGVDIRIPFWGECGHVWNLVFGQHKGFTIAWVEVEQFVKE